MKRIFDLTLSTFLLVLLFIPMLCVAFMVKFSSKGPVFYWSPRVGRRNRIFDMPKFRSMRIETPAVATHLLTAPDLYLSPIGGFLRRTSLDELPQLWSIFKGDMTFVGPRPALYNQNDLVELRTSRGVDILKPGLTGWAQINGRDDLSIADKVLLDEEYLLKRSFWFDLKIFSITILKVLSRVGISH